MSLIHGRPWWNFACEQTTKIVSITDQPSYRAQMKRALICTNCNSTVLPRYYENMNHIDKIAVSVDNSLRVCFSRLTKNRWEVRFQTTTGKTGNIFFIYRLVVMYRVLLDSFYWQKVLIMEIYCSCCVFMLLMLQSKPTFHYPCYTLSPRSQQHSDFKFLWDCSDAVVPNPESLTSLDR